MHLSPSRLNLDFVHGVGSCKVESVFLSSETDAWARCKPMIIPTTMAVSGRGGTTKIDHRVAIRSCHAFAQGSMQPWGKMKLHSCVALDDTR